LDAIQAGRSQEGVNLGSSVFHREKSGFSPKEKSALNIVQDASAALPQNCLERIGY
jgi:hypothetical protein